MTRLSTLLSLGALATALPQAVVLPIGRESSVYDDNAFITVINATPYPWVRTYNHSYQVSAWDASWPATVKPGQSFQMLAGSDLKCSSIDTAAEVRYQLQGTQQPAAFELEYRGGGKPHVNVRYLDELETRNSAKGTVQKLGFHRHPGGIGFVLAGTEGAFISNDGPPDWMQAMLPDIGHLPLRQLTLPRSHHAGMWKAVAPIGLGAAPNTLTQREDLWHQLGDGGVRVLDVRATWWHKHFRESHKSKVGIFGWHGMYGAGVEEMIDVVNRFNAEVPGELIIFDMHADARSASRRMKPLNHREMDKLWALLKRLNHRVSVPEGEDVTRWPLERLIGNRTSAVLVRVVESWIDRDNKRTAFPGSREGFFTETNFPCKTRWTNTRVLPHLMEDQIRHLREAKPRRDTPVWNLDLLLTQQSNDVVWLARDIIDLARHTWRALFHDLWDVLTDQTYPNWLSMDGVHSNQLKTMVMTINHCLAARKCGPLGGKVNSSEIISDKLPK